MFSEASAAAVTCAIMKPELTPPSSTRNGGSPDRFASISSAMRRSDSAPISAIASARLSAANATGSAWKLPPERISPVCANTSGLSDTAFASISSTSAAWRIWSRHAPITCGWQRRLYGSCTRWQSTCDARMSLPREQVAVERRGIALAAMTAHVLDARDRTACRCRGTRRPSSRRRRTPRPARAPRANSPASASAVDTCVPLSSASPSFGSSSSGSRPAAASASRARQRRAGRRAPRPRRSAPTRDARAAPGRPTRRPTPAPGCTARCRRSRRPRSALDDFPAHARVSAARATRP